MSDDTELLHQVSQSMHRRRGWAAAVAGSLRRAERLRLNVNKGSINARRDRIALLLCRDLKSPLIGYLMDLGGVEAGVKALVIELRGESRVLDFLSEQALLVRATQLSLSQVMATVRSLGLHKPSAIPYLVGEGILPLDPPESLYSWQTVKDDSSKQPEEEEELVWTRHCVVWSRGGAVRRIFRFEVEKEAVVQAVLTRFSVAHSRDSDSSEVNTLFPQSMRDGHEAGPALSIRKRRSSPTKPASKHRSKDHSHGRSNPAHPESTNAARDRERALVVVLKTQAYVYFLYGTSHIVHLPFEVAKVFSLPQGIVLQRNRPDSPTVQLTPVMPSAPFNSFAPTHHGSSWTEPSSQHVLRLSEGPDSASSDPIATALKSVLSQHNSNKASQLPSHYCLTDPLLEMSIVAGVEKPHSPPRPTRERNNKGPKALNNREDILYISSIDELGQTRSSSFRSVPFLLALTRNRETGMDSLWSIIEQNFEPPQKEKRRQSTTASGTFSRPRTSLGPGNAAGDTTPIGRKSMGPRESVAGRNDLTINQDLIRDDDDLAAQLDPVGAPVKSSRRISSLMARSELSTNPERMPALDHASTHNIGGKRRGTSFGGPGARSSFGASFRVPSNPRQLANGSRKPSDTSQDSLAEDVDSDEGTVISPIQRPLGFEGEFQFEKIHSMPSPGVPSRLSTASASQYRQSKAFTITASRNVTSISTAELMMCIIDQAGRQFSVLQIHIAFQPSKQSQTSYFDGIYDTRVLGVNKITRGNNVLDACKVTEGSRSRILVLSESPDGFGELTLEAPWSTLIRLQLPSKLLIHSPYQIVSDKFLQRRRDGGIKRVLSHGPEALVALDHSIGQNRVDIVGLNGERHRLEIQLEPQMSFVQKLVQVCERIMPCEGTEREPVIRTWWDTISWLKTHSGSTKSSEWTAFVIVLFSIFLVSVEERPVQGQPRQQRRKGGLLRSSSGSQSNMEAWNIMMQMEGKNCHSLPAWLKDPAWEWILEQGLPSVQSSISPASGTRQTRTSGPGNEAPVVTIPKSTFLVDTANLSRMFTQSTAGQLALGPNGFLLPSTSRTPSYYRRVYTRLLQALHLFREELKLDVLAQKDLHTLAPVLAQIGGWLGWESWGWKESSYYMNENTDMDRWVFDESIMGQQRTIHQAIEPPSILQYLEELAIGSKGKDFVTLSGLIEEADTTHAAQSREWQSGDSITPRTRLMLDLLRFGNLDSVERIELMIQSGLNRHILDSLPEGVAAPLRAVITLCQAQPSSTWSLPVLSLIERNDIVMIEQLDQWNRPQGSSLGATSHQSVRDYHTICNAAFDTDLVGASDGQAELDRQSITRMIFKEDQRFSEVNKLTHPMRHPVAKCSQEPDWSDTNLLEAQQDLVKIVAVRTLSVSPGRAMIFYNARHPLLTEKFPIHGFTLGCVMKPANITVTADRNLFSEDKICWAFFHAGVEAGLSISRGATGIDTSWILFNKPYELNNRHAGFLLALGLNGHLKALAKWVAFKYLTPKHAMTSIGLLLGLGASYLGTMDALITRVLSIHVTRMLPPGSAELNLCPLVQTTGIMAIGLLYCNTQHRRMSEIMLSEIENVDQDENMSPMDKKFLRSEGYRLAAGFALGYINIGQGKNLRGLHDMHIVERLLVLAVGTRKVDIVHLLDKATAAATVAIALIFMKTEDQILAKKIDIPDTTHQFEYVRPDVFLLRTVAKHLIMWNEISATHIWMKRHLPLDYRDRLKLTSVGILVTEDMPLFNIIAGLCLSIGLRYAGTAKQDVRNLLGHYLDQFIRICRLPATNYDGKLTRITVRNCQDVVALAAACVMAGTGDLYIFRRLRSLHGRTDPDTPYGSHLAGHLAMGVLFLAGGTHSLSNSNIAVASLLCAFYPLFPTTVEDNMTHLQAFRHFWVLAAEPRCLVVRDADSLSPLSIPIVIILRSGSELSATAPCLLPPLDEVAMVQTDDPQYWKVNLDFVGNPTHLQAFQRHQSIYVRRRAAYNTDASVFSVTLQALNDEQSAHQINRQIFEWVFELPALRGIDRAERALILSSPGSMVVYSATRSTAVDDRLVLEKACLESGLAERLWNLRVLFAWADKVRRNGGELGWLGREFVEELKAAVWLRGKGRYLE